MIIHISFFKYNIILKKLKVVKVRKAYDFAAVSEILEAGRWSSIGAVVDGKLYRSEGDIPTVNVSLRMGQLKCDGAVCTVYQ